MVLFYYFCTKVQKKDYFNIFQIMIKTGDRVRFLNATGGGMVTRIDQKNNLVYVEDEDGFEIPTLITDCVVIPQINETTNFPRRQQPEVVSSPTLITPTISAPITIAEKREIIETTEGETLKVLLAFFPVNIKQLQTTDYECYLVNDSNYFVFFNIITRGEKNRKSTANGLIEPNTQEEIIQLKKENLNDWENLRVQLLAYKENKEYTPQNVVDATIKLNVVKFYKLHSFNENEYFEEPCMLLDIISEKDKKTIENISAGEIKSAILSKEQKPQSKVFKKTENRKDIIEVDLHITELVDTTAGLTNADMLQLQLDKFAEVLEQNKNHKGQKIVFIHGKGEGVLRKELEKRLQNRYKNYTFQDASFREYGFGATMVTIR